MEQQATPLYVDRLITKRHHGLRHILNVVASTKGAFWMNSVIICKNDVNPILKAELGESELQTK